jgi:hypothetical protein
MSLTTSQMLWVFLAWPRHHGPGDHTQIQNTNQSRKGELVPLFSLWGERYLVWSTCTKQLVALLQHGITSRSGGGFCCWKTGPQQSTVAGSTLAPALSTFCSLFSFYSFRSLIVNRERNIFANDLFHKLGVLQSKFPRYVWITMYFK